MLSRPIMAARDGPRGVGRVPSRISVLSLPYAGYWVRRTTPTATCMPSSATMS
jgi:hypothetical protein